MNRARAIYQFDGAVPTDLPLKEGEIVTVIGKLPGNLWWEGESADGRMGTFPYNYVTELPPEDDFVEFAGKTGISNFDIIQFVTNDQDTYNGRLSILCHVISGDGEYIMEMFHEDYVNLNLLIHDRFPLLGLPPIPTLDMPHDIYKKLIHDYFVYFGIHQMVTPVVLKWLKSIPKTCVSPCPHWNVSIHTTNIVSEEDDEEVGGKFIISVTRGEHYVLLDIEDDYLQLEGEEKQGWCSLRYCEIEWMNHFKGDENSQLNRIIPFSLPSIQCSDDLRINHITMQTLLMCNRFGVQPVEGDTVMLRMDVYIWNSLRGYMYQFFNTKNSLLHVIGSADCSVITELIDHKIQLMREGEKTMIILHSSTDTPKEITSFLEGCLSFYLCYIIDLRIVKKAGEEHLLENMIQSAVKKPAKPVKPAKPDHLFRELAYSIDSITNVVKEDEPSIPIQPVGGVSSELNSGNETPDVAPSPIPVENASTSSVDIAKPLLPPKPSKELNNKKESRPELPPKPAHVTKLIHTLSMRVPPAKPPKPSRLTKLSKPQKPLKPKRAVSSSDSHEGILTERILNSSSDESIVSVQSPI